MKVQDKVSARLENESEAMVVDSIPVPVVKPAREKTHKVFRKSYEAAPAKIQHSE